jgi:hypothetical protein
VLSILAFNSTHDAQTAWGFVVFYAVALLLAVLAYRDYRRSNLNTKWPAVAGIVFASLGGLAYTGVALDPERAVEPVTTQAGQKAVLPHFDYGVWTVYGAIDDSKKNIFDDSVLKFSSQSETADGLQLAGTFTWRLDGVVLGTENFTGHYVTANRRLFLEGVSLSLAKRDSPLVLGSYSATLSADENSLTDGHLGSTAQNPNVPGQWRATR